MPTPKELHQAIIDARADLHATLHQVHGTWEVKPPSADGEDAWSPKEVAQHVIGAHRFFTNLIVQACGAPPLERAAVDVSTPASAAAALARISAADDALLRYVSEADLSKTFAHPRRGPMTVEQFMQLMADHMRDHINQMLAVRA